MTNLFDLLKNVIASSEKGMFSYIISINICTGGVTFLNEV